MYSYLPKNQAILFFLLAALLGCGGGQPDASGQGADGVLIKTLSEQINIDAFTFYRSLNYPELARTEDPELLSRVYDSFRRDVLLEQIYYNLGFRVLDDQVDGFIATRLAARRIPQLPEEEQAMWRSEIRRRIAIQQFLQNKILKDSVVTDEMIHDYFVNHEQEFNQETLYHIRFLQTGTKEQGEAFLKEMSRSKRLFKEVAESYALNESHGLTVPMTLESLAAPFRKAIVDLKPGQHTRLIPLQSQPGGEKETAERKAVAVEEGEEEIDETTNYYILYLESITPESQIPIEEAYEQIRINLEKTKRQELLESTIKRFEGKLLEECRDQLPFQYTPPDQKEEV